MTLPLSSTSWIFICTAMQTLCILFILSLKTFMPQKKHKNTNVVMNKRKPAILVGPSGVGKNTLILALKSRFPGIFGFTVSHTTRNPRTKERNGIDYHFVSKDEFKTKERNNEFIETLTYCDNYYGTSKQAIKDVEHENKICILDIHYTSAQKIKTLAMDAYYLFVTTKGGVQTCVERIKKRGKLSEDEVEKRAQNAQKEFDFFAGNQDFFDECIWNDDLDSAKEDIIEVFEKWYPWLK
eukprot:262850_1